jgi:dTDP-4-amino-4,6-dideoxygalactose transaminase
MENSGIGKDMLYLELENNFSTYTQTKECVAVNTGTAALHLSLEALELPSNSEVIVPQYTMVATAWAVHYAGLKPVFVDCNDDLLINLDDLKNKITSKTKAIMVTHIYGRVANMSSIMDIARQYNLRVIEDAAEAHGCKWQDKHVGSFDIGCFSFYKNKIICGEEGGAIISNDLDFLERARDMRSMSFGQKHNYMHDRIGFNYRITNSQAALILNSLSNVEQNISLRRKNAELYDIMIPEQCRMPKRDVPWVYDIKVQDNTIVDIFRKIGINARYGFKPVSMCAPFKVDATSTKAFEMSNKIMYLPVDPSLSNQDIVRNVEILKELI